MLSFFIFYLKWFQWWSCLLRTLGKCLTCSNEPALWKRVTCRPLNQRLQLLKTQRCWLQTVILKRVVHSSGLISRRCPLCWIHAIFWTNFFMWNWDMWWCRAAITGLIPSLWILSMKQLIHYLKLSVSSDFVWEKLSRTLQLINPEVERFPKRLRVCQNLSSHELDFLNSFLTLLSI